MNKTGILLIFSFITFCFCSCTSEYEQSIQQWQQERLQSLKSPFGWPSVIGLFHLRNTIGYFGRSDTNDFIIPNGPSSFGFLMKTDTGVIMNAYQSVRVKVNGEIVRRVEMLNDKDPEGPTLATYKSFQWHIIDRNGAYYLRMKDSLSQYRQALDEIPYYPINSKFKVEGMLIEPSVGQDSISYKNILGMTISNRVAGIVKFTWNQKEYELTALHNDELTYFIMVHDGTTGFETYGGGRYLYPAKADETGIVILDFNKLINPPCVFTPYATCPLPPKSNHLPFKIEAGEKDLHLY